MAEFEAFPKIPRLNRDIVITEKIDGTNAAVIIERLDSYEADADELPVELDVVRRLVDGEYVGYRVSAQSRKRLITPNSEESKGSDNYGFAAWVRENREDLVDLLGPGRHFGEWWGTGIQHGYGLESQRRFSLFNPRYALDGKLPFRTPPAPGMRNDTIIDVVPVLYRGPFLDREVESNLGELPHEAALWQLRHCGSEAAPGWRGPEGIFIFHEAAGQLFKVTLENDEKPKEVVARETAKVAANGGGKVDLG